LSEEQNPTAAPEGTSTQTKLAAAVIAGYVLGRTKKGGAALALASWLSGNQAGPRAMSMARMALTQVGQSEQVAQIMKQIRGPLMDAAQEAATQAVLSRVTAISNGLTARAQALSEVGGTTVEGTAETVKGSAERVKGSAGTVKGSAGTVKGTAGTVKGSAGTVKGTAGTVKGTAGTVSDTTKMAGGGVKGRVGRLTGRKKGKAEEENPDKESERRQGRATRRGTSTDQEARPTAS
jgi:hypothetical protein